MIFVVYAVVFIVFFYCPAYMKLVIAVANFFMPDLLPVIDEVIMAAGVIHSFKQRKIK